MVLYTVLLYTAQIFWWINIWGWSAFFVFSYNFSF